MKKVKVEKVSVAKQSAIFSALNMLLAANVAIYCYNVIQFARLF